MHDDLFLMMSCDSLYAKHLAATLASVKHNTGSKVHLTLSVSDMTPSSLATLLSSIDRFCASISVHDFRQLGLDGLKPSGHIRTASFARLALPDLLPQRADRAVYIDSDAVVLCDLVELQTSSLHNCPIGAVPNPMEERPPEFKIAPEPGYFNAGVYVLDIPAWRNLDASGECRKIIEEFDDMLTFHDQDVLNILFSGSWSKLDYRWNAQTALYEMTDVNLVGNEPWIVHYTGPRKPWHLRRTSHPYWREYFKYADLAKYPAPRVGRFFLEDNWEQIKRPLQKLFAVDH